ncbi:unnamed protein product [Larinioides sclopetarius]|uniref:Uncharacterized protein n=1 Tax=Larinioides sclopetarius TaxID=280406 RepID=A0AAV2B3N4_9ARAC
MHPPQPRMHEPPTPVLPERVFQGQVQVLLRGGQRHRD